MTEIEISYIKPFIFVSGVLSLILPWVFQINFLGIVFRIQFISIIISDLMYFGLFYLIGLCLNSVFFKYDDHINYFIGHLSLCLVLIGSIGYYATLFLIITQIEKNLDQEIEIEFGPGFYFMIISIVLIILELYCLKTDKLNWKKKKQDKELIPKTTVKKEKKEKEFNYKKWKRRSERIYLLIMFGSVLIFVIFIIFVILIL